MCNLKVYAFQLEFALDIIRVIVVTEKHKNIDYLKARPTFTVAELKDITVFRSNF